MPHWAEIDKDNKVIRVTYGEGSDEESHQWLIDNLGGTWIRTYYSTPGHTFAGIGYTWDPVKKEFNPPSSVTVPIVAEVKSTSSEIEPKSADSTDSVATGTSGVISPDTAGENKTPSTTDEKR